MLYECRRHDRDLSECRDEMAEALPAEAELAAALVRQPWYAGIHGKRAPFDPETPDEDAADILAAIREARHARQG
jgi:hypothetical protein